MINLAGHKDASAISKSELDRCRIPANSVDPYGECKTIWEGKLTIDEEFFDNVSSVCFPDIKYYTFKRNWYYWSISGPVELYVANYLYNDPVGKTDVRAGGHCCAPSPATQCTHYDARGKCLIPLTEKDNWNYYLNKKYVTQEEYDKYAFVEDPEISAFYSFVEHYDIDSEIGLRFFVDTLREFGRA